MSRATDGVGQASVFLTLREWECVVLAALGYNSHQIGLILGITSRFTRGKEWSEIQRMRDPWKGGRFKGWEIGEDEVRSISNKVVNQYFVSAYTRTTTNFRAHLVGLSMELGLISQASLQFYRALATWVLDHEGTHPGWEAPYEVLRDQIIAHYGNRPVPMALQLRLHRAKPWAAEQYPLEAVAL